MSIASDEACDWFISYSHQWVQALPLKPFVLVCERCGTKDNSMKCLPHWERPESGYLQDEKC